ncbi:MAG: hypothetical protein ACRDFB_03345 [Rhabdochlamydiaceae bacterium]
MDKIFDGIKSFFTSQGFNSCWHAALASGVSFVATNGIAPKDDWWAGLGGAVLGGVVGWLNNQKPSTLVSKPIPGQLKGGN